MKYLLDTSSFSDIVWENPAIHARLRNGPDDDYIFICTIVRGEVAFGVTHMPEGRRKLQLASKIEIFFNSIPCEPIPAEAGDHYAEIKCSCRKRGVPLDENDLWIAATAMALDAVLVTRDSDFNQVTGLRLENWSA